jgi:gliding motility-associated-like protein
MKFLKQFLFLLIALSFSNRAFAQYITVDEGFTAQQLVENVLINSTCASVSNVTVAGGNFVDGSKSWGFFNGNGSSFPFQNGIILATGKISNAPGPNTYLSDDGGNMGWGGDQDLNQALNLSNTFNATVLEFDFIPLGNKISFEFIFSSEQYLSNPNSNQCNFTDGFAFLLKETGTSQPYQNLAVIPGTNIPVKVNTVRGPGTICPQANAQYFDAFNGTEHPTNYNGQTKVLIAQSDVTPGVQYHIKLVIADEGNHRFDSAIFLGGGSFNFGINLGEDRLIASGNPVCENETVVLNATSIGAQSYQWKLNGVALVDETNATLTLSPPFNTALQEGIYSVDIVFGPTCTTSAAIEIEFAPELLINQSLFQECDTLGEQDGFTAFNLSSIAAEIFQNLPNNYQIQFFDSPTSTTPLNPNFINTIANQQTIYAKIVNVQGCYPVFPIQLEVNSFSQDISDVTLGFCNGNTIQLNAGNGFVSYNWSTNENSQTINVNSPGVYTVILENNFNCTVTRTFIVVGSAIATIENIEITDFSSSNSALIEVNGIGSYEYSLDGINYQDNNLFINLEPGEYTVYVNDKNGCGLVIETFYILNYPKFFTPNGDGYNDIWQIKNLDKRGFENAKITIFDRYGNLIKQINNQNDFWDGTLRGNNLPSQDYWFVLALPNGKTVRGHFSLIR